MAHEHVPLLEAVSAAALAPNCSLPLPWPTCPSGSSLSPMAAAPWTQAQPLNLPNSAKTGLQHLARLN